MAGWLTTPAGIGHTLGSLGETAPDQAHAWVNGSLWDQVAYETWSDVLTRDELT